ncbi:hypothetical protein [Pararcticibacter amylolyticus]|uniref:Uncharacterized protein n=1 Tax=Pararcticibacter amylolyticus TaxID=2173175 RepID=A0A2U2PBV1_9SPHI|nr:hypothetical protein [Pararcticibacter amylolyticus]PWG78599.1 hypothetical protein DDR33_21195 [Pararcticibacter amylolyticus]
MAFTSDEFRARLDELERENLDWFSKYPPLRENTVNSIHDHYYIYMSGAGHQIRFHADSLLPVELRNQIKDLFDEISGQNL